MIGHILLVTVASYPDNKPVRIDIRNLQRRHLYRVEVDPKNPPRIVGFPAGDAASTSANSSEGEIYLNWDQAIDDRGYLRHCPVCNCKDLYTRKNFPQITGFVIVALGVALSLVLIGYRQSTAAVVVLLVMIAADLAILFLSRRKLVCYRCRSEFHGLPVSRDQRPWDSATAEKYPLQKTR